MTVRRPNQKPSYPSIRGIDWAHPLAKGLAFAHVADDGGGAPRDLVSGKLPTITGTSRSAITSRGIAHQGGAASVINYGRTKADEIRNGSIFMVVQQDTDGVESSAFSSGENSNGFGFQLLMDDVNFATNSFRLQGDNGNQGSAGTDALGTLSHGKMHTLMATFSASNQLWYANGALKNTTGSGFTATAHANRVTKMFCRRSDDLNLTGKILCCYAWDRILTINEVVRLEKDVFQFLRLVPFIAAKVPAAGGITGTLAVTLDDTILAAQGTTTVTGSLAQTLAGVTLAAQGTTTVKGSLAQTLAGATLAAQGTTTIVGSLAQTLADATLVASGSVGSAVDGTLAVTLANATIVAQGTTTIVGSLAQTLTNATIAAQGTTTIKGTLAQTLDNTTLAASGAAGTPTGTLAVTLDNVTLSAFGVGGPASNGVNDSQKRRPHNSIYTIQERGQQAHDKALVDAAIAEAEAAVIPVPIEAAKAAKVTQPSPVNQAQEAAYAAALRQLEDDEEAIALIMELV